jgi:steroid delta-isomerase-like uncharacterized protein
MERNEVQRIAEGYVEAWSATDTELMREFCTDDVVLYQAPVKQRLQGLEHLIKRGQAFDEMGEDVTLGLRKFLYDPEENTLVLEVNIKGRHTGRFLNYEPTGREFDLDSCLVLTLNDEGKITQHTTYFDTATMLRAIGLITIEGLPEAA